MNEARTSEDHELPGIPTIPAANTSSLRTTPLLLLLDGVLSRDEARVTDAMNDIIHKLRVYSICSSSLSGGADCEHSSTRTPSHSQPQHYTQFIESPCTCAASLELVLSALLDQYPDLARIPSDHDGSLPLHFAASLGNVPAAQAILRSVRCACVCLSYMFFCSFMHSQNVNLLLSCQFGISVPARCNDTQSKRENTLALCGSRRTYRNGTILFATPSGILFHRHRQGKTRHSLRRGRWSHTNYFLTTQSLSRQRRHSHS